MLAINEITKPGSVSPMSACPSVSAVHNSNDVSPLTTNTVLQKDSQWLTLEICREHLRNKCQRSDLECKFAHPPKYYPLEIHHGRVICCYDYIKGKCNRKSPPCKYLHPPQHLKEQLLQNGRNNLIVKNLQYNIIRKQMQTSPYYGAINPVQMNISNLYNNLQQSALLPQTVLGNGTNVLQCMLPMNLMSPYSGEFQFNYSLLKDSILTSKPSSLLTNHGIIPGVLIQPLLPSGIATSTTDNFHQTLLSNHMLPNTFIN